MKNQGFCGTPSPPGFTASMYQVRIIKMKASTTNITIKWPIVIWLSGATLSNRFDQWMPSAAKFRIDS